MNLFLADIGATKSRFARSDGRRLGKIVTYPTPPTWKAGRALIAQAAEQLFGKQKISAGVLGLPGELNPTHTKLVSAGNLKGWVGQPIHAWVGSHICARVQLENDALLNGLGEAIYGAGRGYAIVGFLTVSTGINGIRIVNQRPDVRGFAMELRHMLVHHHGENLTLGQSISGRAIALRHGNRPADRIKNRGVWSRAVSTLATAVINLELAWTPNIMVLGGPVLESLSMLKLRQAIRTKWRHHAPPPRLVRGSLGDRSGLYGALALARQR